ncbi:MAG: MaoC family dehydratase N-terminal domain-containing protein [Hydrogenophaga sp.]|nr:MaoC family dehydratase N-terminal domain-containing protein [Hydrogenophaga sp.]
MSDWLENHTIDEIVLGQKARLLRTLRREDILAFAAVSGDVNPAHLDPEYAAGTVFHGVIAHGMWGGALISALLGTVFPGPGTIYLEQQLRFSRPVHLGDTLTVEVVVIAIDEKHRHLDLDCHVRNQHEEVVISGLARVLAPRDKLRIPRPPLPGVQVTDEGAATQSA